MIPAILLSLLAVQSAPATGASDSAAADRARTEACLAVTEDQTRRRACIGLVALPCLNLDEGQSTAGQLTCLGREIAVWRALLDERRSRIRAAFDADAAGHRRDEYEASAAAWETHWRALCELEASEFAGGSLSRVVRADCANRETAFRVIYLDVLALDQPGL